MQKGLKVDTLSFNGLILLMLSTGKGIKLAVVDTRVDYFHPSLGNGFGLGKKISFGKDFVGVGLPHVCSSWS